MKISEAIDETLRALIERVLKNDPEGTARVIERAGPEAYEQVASLATEASAYVALHLAKRWPLGTDLKTIADSTASAIPGVPVIAKDVHTFLARSVFGDEPVANVFKDNEEGPFIPVYALASLLISFKSPKDRGWNAWLDVIEDAIEQARQIPDAVLPAAAYRHQKK